MYKKYIKRLLDVLFALTFLPLVIPIILFLGLLIKREDRGPIFYCGKRLGKNGKVFIMYKLRTMKVNAPDLRNEDLSTFNSQNDPRLTKIGKILRKTSLDELPQIINVLKGDMSFIGPRPDLPEHINCYEGEEIRKLEVLPGISGYNQAYYRNSIEWKSRLKNDLYYLEHLSFLFDLKILAKTFQSIFFQRGIFINKERTHDNSQDKVDTPENIICENYECIALKWDTKYFGIKSAKVILKGDIPKNGQDVIMEYCNKFEFITILNTNNNKHNNYWLGIWNNSFLVDINVRFKKILAKEPYVKDEFTKVYNMYTEDRRVLEIADSAFRHSRFFNDPNLMEKKAEKIYKYWTECAFGKVDKHFVITRRNNDVAGYLLFTMEEGQNYVTIELIAVDKKYQGQQVGKSLMAGLEMYAWKRNAKEIRVGTQIDNISAVKFYISCGFQYEGCNSIYHLWNNR